MNIASRQCLFVLIAAMGCSMGRDAFSQDTRVALRDPTQPPAIHFPSVGTARLPGDNFKPVHLVSVGNARYVVWNSKRYAVGATLEGARIERITESEVWLRNVSGLRKVPLFTGIEKRSLSSASSSITSPRANLDVKNGPTK